MKQSSIIQYNKIPAENLIVAGARGQTWIVYADTGRPDYVAKKKTVFSESCVAQLLENTCHPSLPRCYGSSYMAIVECDCYMFEYIEGIRLSDYKYDDNFKLLEMFAVLFDLLTFMQTMFDKPLLHLDIKPDNIVIKNCGQPVLIDFDSACLDPENSTSCTHCYAAPEHRGGKPALTSDVYSLAITCLEKLIGINAAELLNKPVSEVAEMIPADSLHAGRILIKCIAASPEDRPLPDEVASKLKRVNMSEQDVSIEDNATKAVGKSSVICVWQSAEMACELAAEISRHRENVLLIDANWLNPKTDMLLGMRKLDKKSMAPALTSYLDAALSAAVEEELSNQKLTNLARKTGIENLSLLMPSGRYDFYECDLAEAYCRLIDQAQRSYDLIIISAGPVIYDDLTCISLALSEKVLTAVRANTADIRSLSRLMTFIRLNQLTDLDKFSVAAHDYCKGQELSLGSLAEIFQDRFIGAVTNCQRRRSDIGSGRPYAMQMSKANRNEYARICNKLNVI